MRIRAVLVAAGVIVALNLGGVAAGVGPGDPVGPAPTAPEERSPVTKVPDTGTDTGTGTGTAPDPVDATAEELGTDSASGVPWWVLVAGVGVGVAAGLGVGVVLVRRNEPAVPASVGGSAALSPAAPPPEGAPVDPALDRLIRSVIDARDLVEPGGVLFGRLGTALHDAGIEESHPLGERFDPDRHRAVGAVATADPAAVDIIAEVQRVGYESGAFATIVRHPDVAVYRMEEPSP